MIGLHTKYCYAAKSSYKEGGGQWQAEAAKNWRVNSRFPSFRMALLFLTIINEVFFKITTCST